MTTSLEAMRYQHALERWRMLADRRLEHITLLYETGRWKRYFTEEKFLTLIRDTKEAVERWHRLAPPRFVIEVRQFETAGPPMQPAPGISAPKRAVA